MQRKHKTKYENDLHRYFSYNWHQCCRCKNDFKYEFGWKFEVGPFYGGKGTIYYICHRCASDIEKANSIVYNRRYLPEPPPKRYSNEDIEIRSIKDIFKKAAKLFNFNL